MGRPAGRPRRLVSVAARRGADDLLAARIGDVRARAAVADVEALAAVHPVRTGPSDDHVASLVREDRVPASTSADGLVRRSAQMALALVRRAELATALLQAGSERLDGDDPVAVVVAVTQGGRIAASAAASAAV